MQDRLSNVRSQLAPIHWETAGLQSGKLAALSDGIGLIERVKPLIQKDWRPIGREDSGWEILLLEDRHRAQMCFWATTADRKVGLAQGSKVLVTRCGDPALSVSARPPTHWAVEHSSAND